MDVEGLAELEDLDCVAELTPLEVVVAAEVTDLVEADDCCVLDGALEEVLTAMDVLLEDCATDELEALVVEDNTDFVVDVADLEVCCEDDGLEVATAVLVLLVAWLGVPVLAAVLTVVDDIMEVDPTVVVFWVV